MKQIIKIVPLKVTNEWFEKLGKKDKEKLKELVQEQDGLHLRYHLNMTPERWWATCNHVKRSYIYTGYRAMFKIKQPRSRGRKKETAPSNKTEGEINGS